MRHMISLSYSVLHLLVFFAFWTKATLPGWINEAPNKNRLSFDLNLVPADAEILPPEIRVFSSDEPMPSSQAMALPGLNPSASVQSASSHGRHHSEYPLAQHESSSSRLSSSSHGQRKTSDSSTSSTSRRSKKASTSHRYEPYSVTHSSLKNSVSDVMPTSSSSSRPASVLPTENTPTRDAPTENNALIRLLRRKKLAVSTHGLSTSNKPEQKLFDVYDWNFLREHPEREGSDDHLHQFLRYLNQCKGASDLESFFFIQRDQAIDFLKHFTGRRSHVKFNLPAEVCRKGLKVGKLFEILVSLSDKKIGLDGHPFFENEIMDGMKERLIENFTSAKYPVGSQRIETIVRFVRDVTKVTQLLMVAQLSLFKEHKQDFLTAEAVEQHLRFLHELWLKIETGAAEIVDREWAMTAHHFLNFLPLQTHIFDAVTQKSKNYQFAWNLIHYWHETTSESSQFKKGFYQSEKFPKKLKELVGKLVFFANYQPQLSGSS